MKRHEFLIEKLESFPTRTDLTDAERKRLRYRYFDLYQEAIGVPPDFREELRGGLEAISARGERTVESLMEEIRHRVYSRPLGSA